MSRTIDNAIEAVAKSQFSFIDNGQLEVRNAHIFWTNFSGKENRFGHSAKTFNLAISEEMAKELDARGWRVRDVDQKDDDEEVIGKLYFVNIKVNMESGFPPIVTLFSEYKGKKSRVALTNETIGELDRADILDADCIINPYESPNFPGKVTGYLRKLNIIHEPDIEFDGKYDDWMADGPIDEE